MTTLTWLVYCNCTTCIILSLTVYLRASVAIESLNLNHLPLTAKSIKASDLKLHRQIDFIVEKCSEQLPIIYIMYIFMLTFVNRTPNVQTTSVTKTFFGELQPVLLALVMLVNVGTITWD